MEKIEQPSVTRLSMKQLWPGYPNSWTPFQDRKDRLRKRTTPIRVELDSLVSLVEQYEDKHLPNRPSQPQCSYRIPNLDQTGTIRRLT